MRSTAILLAGLALMSSGCASLRHPTEWEIVQEQEQQEQAYKSNVGPDSIGWYLIYYGLYGFGVFYVGSAGN